MIITIQRQTTYVGMEVPGMKQLLNEFLTVLCEDVFNLGSVVVDITLNPYPPESNETAALKNAFV